MVSHPQVLLNGRVVSLDLRVASGFIQRLVGLLFTPKLEEYQGLIIKPCSDVHSFGMAYSLDLVFLNSDFKVVKLASLKPNGICNCRGASSVIELAEYGIEKYGIELDDCFSFTCKNNYGEVVS